jgi:hypothetical protein
MWTNAKIIRPQYYIIMAMLVSLIMSSPKSVIAQQVSVQDSIELIEFAQQFGGLTIGPPAVPVPSSWNDPAVLPTDSMWNPNVNPITDWYGVTWVDSANVGTTLKVASIDLSNIPLNAPITMIIADMDELEILNLNNCGLFGPVPSSFLNPALSKLRILNLNNNNLDFSANFFNLISPLFGLDELYLRNSFNPITVDSLPSFSVPNLKILDISENDFTGELDLVGNPTLANLQELYATNNLFSDLNMNANSNLAVLKINNNNLASADDLVNVLDSALNLMWLEANNALDTNGLTHSFNPTGAYLNSVENLQIQMRYNNFDGVFALEYFGDVPSVYHLDISHNKIDSIVPFLNQTSSMNYLKLSHNEISMKMTLGLLNNMPNIEQLLLNDNDFYGVKPVFQEDKYEFIRVIDFSNNPRLRGTIDLENLLANNTAVERLDFSNCNFNNVLEFSAGIGNFPNFEELHLEGNRLHFDDLFFAVRSLNFSKDTAVFDPVSGNLVAQFIPPYWTGIGQGQLFDTLDVFTYWPQDSAGVGGVRRRPQTDSVFFQTNVGFDPEIVNTVKWYRQSATTGVIEAMGGVKATSASQDYSNTAFPANTTATNLSIGLGIDNPHFIRMTNLDTLIHGDWLYYAEVEHDSFPLLQINTRAKKLVIGECFDSLGARINCQEIVVQFRDTTSDETKRNIREQLGVTLIDSCVCGTVELWSLSDTTNRAQVEAVGRGTRIASGQASNKAELLSADPNYLLLDGTTGQNTTPPSFIQGTTNDSPILMAIIDSGVDLDNPKLKKRIWVNQDDSNNDGQDNDADCEVDNGWGWNYLDRNNNTDDDHGHGTAVATVASGLNPANELANFGNDDYVAIVPYKYTDSKGTGSVFEAACAIYQASNYADPLPNGDTARVRVINASWGYYGEPCIALENAIKYSGDQCGILFIASAGNDGENTSQAKHWPSNSPFPGGDTINSFNNNVIAVAAYDENNPDMLAAYSNYGSQHIDLAADGTVQAYPANGDTSNLITQSGTSFAAPLVARAAALLYHEFPDASYGAVRQAILEGVDSLQSADANLLSSGGRLNYSKARQILLNMVNRDVCMDEGFVVGVEEIAQNQAQLAKVFPNPFDAQLQIELSENLFHANEPISIQLMSIDGRIIEHRMIEGSTNRLELSTEELAKGMYLLHIQQGEKQQIQKIVKFR